MTHELPEKVYLGDSVYAAVAPQDATMIVLTTENGLPNDPSNTIYVERSVFEALEFYARRMWPPREPVGSDG